LDVEIYDPWADSNEVKHEYGLEIINKLDDNVVYDALIVAVAHKEFLTFDYNKVKRNNGVIFDTKACLDRSLVDARL